TKCRWHERGSFRTSPRRGAPARRTVMGIARGDKSCTAVEKSTAGRRGEKTAGIGLRTLYRRFRDGRFAGGEKPVGTIVIARHWAGARLTASADRQSPHRSSEWRARRSAH